LIATDVARVVPAARLRGDLRLPGDKSISHRALLLATLASGACRITAASDGADVRSTASAMRSFGASVTAAPDADGRNVDYRVASPGADGLEEPDGVVDCGTVGFVFGVTAPGPVVPGAPPLPASLPLPA